MTRITHLVVTVAFVCTGALAAAEPRLLEVRTQKVEGVTYFHARLERPADLRLPVFDMSKPFSDSDRGKFARLPRLVPQDDKTRVVYFRHKPSQPSLNFFGQTTEGSKATLVLVYPTQPPAAKKESPAAGARADSSDLAEVTLELDFAKAVAVPIPKLDPDDQHLEANDLRSHWALHQAAHFAVLETQVLDFPFYSFAREATGRKYGVVSPPWVKRQLGEARHRLYEVTTGADAIAETLQLHRLLEAEARPGEQLGERSVPLSEVAGITVPEQPWDRLLAGKEPATEPIAQLIPHDNYYVYFRDLRKFIDAGELLDDWGTSLIRVYEMKSRDCQLRERYERQLCLKTTALGKALGPALVKGLAITGSDPYFREGTDVTVVVHVVNRGLFLAAVEGFLRDARLAHGSRLSEGSEDYRGTTIEKFVTPLREVSLHRAAVKGAAGEFVIYSNSPAGVRRVLNAQQGRGKRLADASDFRYMRTVFPLDDRAKGDKPKGGGAKEEKPKDDAEDGFVFLSDAFLRQLTGPATRIKEKRRLEALTSAYMLTGAALFCAWESGKLPADHAAALAAAGLRPADIVVPEGRGVVWDPQRQLAVSNVYNTIHFSTPLVELPLEKVTPAEAEQYGRFRDEYSRLWRTYFDPIGMRLSLDERRVRVETHILPLAGSDAYRTLREVAGRGTIRFEPTKGAVLDFQVSLFTEKAGFSLHLGGDGVLRELIGLLTRWEADPGINLRQEYDRLFWKLPLGVAVFGDGAEGRRQAEEAARLMVEGLKSDFLKIVSEVPPPTQYKEVTLHKLTIDAVRYRELAAFVPQAADSTPLGTFLTLLPTQEAPPALYVAAIGRGVHFSASEDFLKKLIDHQAEAEKKAHDKQPAAPAAEVNAGFAIAPGNAREAASLLLEHEGRSLALLNNQAWNCFYQSGLLPPRAADGRGKGTTRTKDQDRDRDVVRNFLGYVPVSPDGSPYDYDARLREVASRRHGSYRRPALHDKVEPTSELGRLLDQIKTLRAELRFHDSGLHTVLTIERR